MGARPEVVSRRAHEMVDVVLESDDEPDLAGGRGGLSPRGPGRRGVGPVVTVAVVLVVVAINVVHSAHQSRREAVFAAMPGVVQPLDEPLAKAWELGQGSAAMAFVDGLLLYADEAEGAGRLHAVDVATGEERWSVPRGGRGQVDSCGGRIGPAEDPLVLCWSYGAVVDDPLSGEPTFVGPRLVGLRLADGSIAVDRRMDVPRAGYGLVDGELITGLRDGAVLTVERQDPVTGEPRWTVDVALEAELVDGTTNGYVEVSDGLVVVTGPTTAVLSAEDGRTLGTWHAPPVGERRGGTELPGADVVTTESGFAAYPDLGAWSGSGGTVRSPLGTLYDAQGSSLADLNGFVVDPEVTDGSRPEVVLLSDGAGEQLTASDITTGRELWAADLEGGAVLLRRDGAVVVSDGDQVRSLDLRSGSERWATAVDGLRPDLSSVTDGRTVVVLAAEGGRRLMTALDLSSGELLWTAPAPLVDVLDALGTIGGLRLAEVDGHVVYAGAATVIGLR